jgi:hypothetical protein
MEIKILTNYDNELYCSECKTKIKFLEKFGIIKEEVYSEIIEKCYHLNCLPESYDDDIYLTEE